MRLPNSAQIVLIACTALTLAVSAESQLSRSRELSDGWLFQPDPSRLGDTQHWERPGFERSGWRHVNMPMAWDFYDPVMDGYEGVGWYAFVLPADRIDAQKSQWLRFGRVNHHATVWINGEKAGEDSNGYLPFDVPISQWVKPGQTASIVVRVENGVRYDWLPGATTVEWVQYGGFLQPVELVTTTPAHIAHVAIRAMPRGGDASVSAVVEIANDADTAFEGHVRLVVGARAVEAAATIMPRSNATVSLETAILDAQTWSPASPVLYDAVVHLLDNTREIDTITERFGVRNIETDGRRILLNNQPLQIRGVNRYDEFPGRGPVADESAIRADLEAVKAAGANFIRVHYPQTPATLRIADEIGLLVMEEVPLNWWRASFRPPVPPEFQNDRIVDAAEDALARMVRRDANHPSVIMWSVANECETSDEMGIRAMERLLRRAKALDPTRLATYVANRKLDKNRAFALADLVAVNFYFGLWDGEVAENLSEIDDRVYAPTRDALAEVAKLYPDKPMLLTEFGTIGIPGAGGDMKFSEDYQAAYVAAVWRAIVAVPEMSGGVVWAWADYRHRRGFTNDFPTYFGPFGIVTFERQPKKAHGALQELWTKANATN